MKIEEAIKVIKSALCLDCMDSDKCNLCRVTEAIHYIEDMSNELQWYRDQDLIKREDVISVVSVYYALDVFERWGLLNRIENHTYIPKAEPTSE